MAACVVAGLSGTAAADCFPPFSTDNGSCITSFTPSVAQANAPITIKGSRFQNIITSGFVSCTVHITSVTLAGVPGTNPTATDNNTIIVNAGTPPGNTLPSGDVVVTTTLTGPGCPVGTFISQNTASPSNFTYESRMFIRSVPSSVSQIGQSYSQLNIVTGGAGPPYTFSVSNGSLPPGAMLDTGTGTVSGTLTAPAGPFSYIIEAVDVNGQKISASTAGSTAPPTVTGVTTAQGPPARGPAAGGQLVTIQGTGFSGATSVMFGGVSVGFSVLSPPDPSQTGTQIAITTLPHAPGLVSVVVTTPAGTGTGADLFEYLPGPTVATISPASGPLTGGQAVTITGTNFDPAANQTFVTIGGVAATNVLVSGTTQITATTPANAAGPQSVAVTTVSGGTGRLVNGYTYQVGPTVTAISPPSGPTAGGQAVTITGTNFTGATSVTIGSVAATGVIVASSTSITAITPAHVTGATDVVVTTPGPQQGTGVNLYTYIDAPTVTLISPAAGPLVGGQAVTITGTNFTTGTTSVTLGGVAATNVVVTSPTTLTATTPAHAAGVVNVVATTPSGSGTGTGLYTYGTLPIVIAINPATGPIGGGQAVTITGVNFTGATSVTIGGVAAAIGTVSATTITATTPAHAAGVVDVVVTTPSGSGTGTGFYTYVNPLAVTVTLISPAVGPLVGGQAVTVTGTNFTGTTAVTIGGVAAMNVVVVGPTTITATTPAHAAGVVNVVVTTPSGSGTGTNLYTYATVPIVTAISPATGPIGGGQAVTITGQNFTGATSVTIGGVAAAIGTVSATTITATTPAHAAGQADVVVTTPIGTATGTKIYTYVVALTLASTPATTFQVGQTYSQQNTASGGTPGYTYAVTGGALPAGTSLSASSGLVFGTPTTLGAFSYTITATDSSVPALTASQTVTGTIGGIVSDPDLASSPNPSLLGQLVTFTATETPNTCTGTITFTDLTAATVLCAAVPIVNGFATCKVKFTTAGAHQIQATYPGSAQCLPSVSPVLVQTVNDQRIKTVETIGNFLSRRNDLIMSSEPDLNRQVDRLTEADGQSVGGQPGAPAFAGSGSAARLGAGPDAGDLTRMRFGLRDRPGTALPDGGLPGSPSMLGLPDSDLPTGGGTVKTGPMQLTGNTDGVTRFSFSTSLHAIARYAAAAEASKTAEAGAGFTAGPGLVGAARFKPFDIWVEGKYTNFRDNSLAGSASGMRDGQFGLVSVGADYVFSRWLLVGVMGQFDILTPTSHAQGNEASANGRGWMVGPYATLRLTDNLFWQARGAWGQSSNEVSPFGTYTDKFDSERRLASSTLVGRWGFEAWQFRPSVSVAYMEDVAQSYTDTFGIVIPEVKSRLGQAKAGPEIGYRYQFNPDLTIEPHVGMQAIYNFAGDTTSSLGVVAGQNVGPDGVRGRIEIGQRAITSGGIAVDMSASYDGIGAKGYEAYSARAQVHLPLH